MEIERKYLLSALPPREILGRGVAIRQGYIDAADPEIRVRQKGSELFLTVKSGAGVRREECEVQIPAATFEKLWSLTEGARVVKTRYTVPHGDARWEIDEFGDALADLYLAEVELASESATVTPPAFLAIVRDVTAAERDQHNLSHFRRTWLDAPAAEPLAQRAESLLGKTPVVEVKTIGPRLLRHVRNRIDPGQSEDLDFDAELLENLAPEARLDDVIARPLRRGLPRVSETRFERTTGKPPRSLRPIAVLNQQHFRRIDLLVDDHRDGPNGPARGEERAQKACQPGWEMLPHCQRGPVKTRVSFDEVRQPRKQLGSPR